MSKKLFFQDTIAMVYDFDGTLSPQPMQEYTVLPELGIGPREFWSEVDEQALADGEEGMLTYMRLLIEKADEKKAHVGRGEFKRLGSKVEYFPGVETWFDRINTYAKERSGGRVRVRHYIISAGLKEILEGVSIKKHFHQIYASEYHYDHHGVATFPKLLITDTSKTQFLFRINKGKESISESINTHMPSSERPVPFENILYIGDGETDVPSMAVTRQNGGAAVAVFKSGRGKREQRTKETCKRLLEAGRVNFIAPADYSSGSVLEKRVILLLDAAMARIECEREVMACRREAGLSD